VLKGTTRATSSRGLPPAALKYPFGRKKSYSVRGFSTPLPDNAKSHLPGGEKSLGSIHQKKHSTSFDSGLSILKIRNDYPIFLGGMSLTKKDDKEAVHSATLGLV
jgi:hypothetical protein